MKSLSISVDDDNFNKYDNLLDLPKQEIFEEVLDMTDDLEPPPARIDNHVSKYAKLNKVFKVIPKNPS